MPDIEIKALSAGPDIRSMLCEIERGRWLLVLDTAVDEGASRLYERVGFKLSGIIPDYAFRPHGDLAGTMIYWERLQQDAAL
jgi:ribosomal protein S18 acetylase RimI-like enzyme